MKITFLALIAVVAVASAQATASTTSATAAPSLGALPPCARTCVDQFTSGSNIGGCSATDIVCICSSSTFLSGIACCLAGQCDVADQESATSYARNFCGISGVTNLPTAVSCTSTSSATATPSPSAKANAGPPNVAGMGAGIVGGIAAAVALL